LFADVALHGHRQLTTFTIASTSPSLSVGFTHPAVDVGSNLAMVNALQRADTQVLVGGSELQPGIAYGWRLVGAWVQRRDGSADPLAHIALNGEHFSIIGAYADTLWLGGGGRPGLLELAQTLLMDLEPGERIVYEREIILGDRADVASVTDQLWPDGPEIVASVGQANTAVHVVRHDDAPITFVRSDAKGRVRFRLPPGEDVRYKLLIAGPGDQFETHPLRVNGPRVDLGALATPEAATLMLPQGEPLRLVFLGVAPTPDPLIGGDGIRFWVGQERIAAATESNHVSLAGAAGDPDHVRLAPGHYRVLATRGPEWSVSSAEIELVAGQRARLDIQPPIRVLDTPGWLSADLHVHAAPSDDSALPLRRRIAAFAAQGADVIVSTEHDNVFDYGPLIRQLGLDDRIASLVGVEITSTSKGPNAPSTSGHANAFPLRRDPLAYRGGAPRGENVRLRTLLADLHARPLAPILQLNHPREAGFDADYGSYFSHLAVGRGAYDPIRPLDHAQNRALIERDRRSGLRDLDFDAVELLNGPSMTRYRLTRGDWLSLIRQGEVRVGTANSDSHSTRHLVALPRRLPQHATPGRAAAQLCGLRQSGGSRSRYRGLHAGGARRAALWQHGPDPRGDARRARAGRALPRSGRRAPHRRAGGGVGAGPRGAGVRERRAPPARRPRRITRPGPADALQRRRLRDRGSRGGGRTHLRRHRARLHPLRIFQPDLRGRRRGWPLAADRPAGAPAHHDHGPAQIPVNVRRRHCCARASLGRGAHRPRPRGARWFTSPQARKPASPQPRRMAPSPAHPGHHSSNAAYCGPAAGRDGSEGVDKR
ncbi:MAG: PHP domain-containing protein, partial [Deltaproteobacteria bacterium]|nr:PHP domain-containing protein [Deltaproteobacteria bacterium]